MEKLPQTERNHKMKIFSLDPHEAAATFADHIAILAMVMKIIEDHEEASRNLQKFIDRINACTKTWNMKLNGDKVESVHVYFTNKASQHFPLN